MSLFAMTNPYMSWFFNLTVTAAVFALPGLTAAGNVHCQLPVNSAFFTFYWTNWLDWIFLLLHCQPYRNLYHLSWPLSVPKPFLKGPLPVTGLLWVLTVLALWKRWKLQHLEIIINVVGLSTKYRSIGLKRTCVAVERVTMDLLIQAVKNYNE